MKNLHAITAIALLTFLTSGCILEESVQVPGPQGPPGNANVFALHFDFLMADAVVNGAVASVQFDIPDFTASIVDDGMVMLFYRDQGTWTAMPYTFGVESPDMPAVDYTVSLGYGYELGFLEIFYEASTDQVDLFGLPDRRIKAVCVDGYYYGKRDIDWTDWETVKRTLNLSE